jgi:hypothetical protein
MLLAILLLAVCNSPVVKASPLSAEFDCTVQTSIPADQCEALIAVFEATGGEDWANNSGWLQTADPCQWYGVSCSEGKVVALDLYGNRLTGSLPLEIGGFPDLKTLTINGNSLSGPIPLTITFMDLDLFHFHNTSLCEPADPTFQDWFSQIVYRLSSGTYCSAIEPTTTPNPAQTQTVSNLPWPQQTLTALAEGNNSGLAAFTPEPTATKYYNLESPTPEGFLDSQSSSGGDTFGMNETTEKVQPTEERTGFFAEIPSGWLVVLTIPLVLIVIGVLLEMRDRRKDQNEKRPSPLEYGDIETRN